MTIVPWVTLAPEQTERVVGVLLGREHEHSVRLRPSQGDGGIDVLDPTDDKRVDVYQVKSFATALTTSRKRKIADSLNRAADNPRVVIRDWYLTIPINPSPEDLDWFGQLIEGVPFGCHWYGLDRLEGLAAAHQDVIDYYLRDGRQRLEQSIAQLRLLAGITQPPSGQLVAPSDITAPLTALYELLNRDDPHFRYEFEVTADPPRVDQLREKPWLVASFTSGDGKVAVTHHVYALYAMATEDAPIPLTFTVQQGRMDEVTAAAWEQAMRYGTPVVLPTGTVTDAHFGLPGGLATSAAEVALRLSAARNDNVKEYRLRLRLIDPDDELVAETLVNMEPVTRGVMGGGVRAHGIEAGGSFELEILTDLAEDGNARNVRLNVAVADLVGLPPAALTSGLRFLAVFHQPNRLQFAPEYGPAANQAIDVPVDVPPITGQLIELVEALADLQMYAASDLRVPNLDLLSDKSYREILQGGRLVRGETIYGTWTEYTIPFTETSPSPVDGPVQLALTGSYRFAVGERLVTLEPITKVLLAAEFSLKPDGNGILLEAHPAMDNNTILMRLAPIEEVLPQALGAESP